MNLISIIHDLFIFQNVIEVQRLFYFVVRYSVLSKSSFLVNNASLNEH